MSLTLQATKPPYVRFDYKEVEDRAQTIAQGRYIAKSVPFAYITSAGSKDENEKNAEEWLDGMKKQQHMEGKQYLAEWHKHFSHAFSEWKAGNEMPETGTPIKSSLLFKPHEIRSVLDANIRTLEDLAQANEESLSRISPGARVMQEQARKALSSANEQVDKLNKALEAETASKKILEERMTALEQANRELLARLDTPVVDPVNGHEPEPLKRKPGRPKKVAEAA